MRKRHIRDLLSDWGWHYCQEPPSESAASREVSRDHGQISLVVSYLDEHPDDTGPHGADDTSTVYAVSTLGRFMGS